MRKISGSVVILIAMFWIWYYGRMVFDELFYKYLFFCFRPPFEVSVVNSILGVLGLVIGIKTFRNRLKPFKAILFVIGLIIIGLGLEIFGYRLF